MLLTYFEYDCPLRYCAVKSRRCHLNTRVCENLIFHYFHFDLVRENLSKHKIKKSTQNSTVLNYHVPRIIALHKNISIMAVQDCNKRINYVHIKILPR